MISIISLDNKNAVTEAINKLIVDLSIKNKVMQHLADGTIAMSKVFSFIN